MLADDLAGPPGLAVVVAVNDRDRRGAMLPHGGRQPDRRQQASVAQLNAVAGAGGQHVPVVVFAKRLECIGDVLGLAERDAVVVAIHVVAAMVIDAVEKMDAARVAIDGRRGVVHGVFAGVGDALRRRPGFSAVGAAAEQDFDIGPVGAAAPPGFAVGEDRAVSRDDNSGNAKCLVAALPGVEQIGLIELRLIGRQRRRGKAGQAGQQKNRSRRHGCGFVGEGLASSRTVRKFKARLIASALAAAMMWPASSTT